LQLNSFCLQQNLSPCSRIHWTCTGICRLGNRIQCVCNWLCTNFGLYLMSCFLERLKESSFVIVYWYSLIGIIVSIQLLYCMWLLFILILIFIAFIIISVWIWYSVINILVIKAGITKLFCVLDPIPAVHMSYAAYSLINWIQQIITTIAIWHKISF